MMLYSLPTSYENFRIAIESRDVLPNPEDLKIKIIEESDARQSCTSKDVEGAFYNKNKKYFKTNSTELASECWSKGKFIKRNEKVSSVKQQKSFGILPTCLHSTAIENNNKWCLDSGCSSHMTGVKENFCNIQDETGYLKLASDNHTTDIAGKGKVEIKIKNMQYNLLDTLYVPELSVKKRMFDKKGI